MFPALCVGVDRLREREKEDRSGRRQDDCSFSEGRLKSPSRISEDSTGSPLRRVSSSSMKLPSGPGGR